MAPTRRTRSKGVGPASKDLEARERLSAELARIAVSVFEMNRESAPWANKLTTILQALDSAVLYGHSLAEPHSWARAYAKRHVLTLVRERATLIRQAVRGEGRWIVRDAGDIGPAHFGWLRAHASRAGLGSGPPLDRNEAELIAATTRAIATFRKRDAEAWIAAQLCAWGLPRERARLLVKDAMKRSRA